MERLLTVWGMGVLLLLTGCGHSPDPGVTPTSSAELLQPPGRAARVEEWRTFATNTVQSELSDASIHPFTFVIPTGDDAEAQDQRKAIAATVRGMLANTALPGKVLAFTGADSAMVAAVIVDALRDLPGLPARGLTIIFIGTAEASNAAGKAVRAAGGNLRLRPMAPLR